MGQTYKVCPFLNNGLHTINLAYSVHSASIYPCSLLALFASIQQNSKDIYLPCLYLKVRKEDFSGWQTAFR